MTGISGNNSVQLVIHFSDFYPMHGIATFEITESSVNNMVMMRILKVCSDYFFIPLSSNRISDAFLSVLASSAIDCGFEPDRVKPKTIKLVFVFPCSIKEKEQKLVGSESG